MNSLPERELADIIYQYGEERKSRQIARRIAEKRELARINTTFELADIVRSVVRSSPKDKSDPATRTFQALRIAVNDELGELQRALRASASLLAVGGRLVVVSFHSLEDGIVKSFLYESSGRRAQGSRHLPQLAANDEEKLFELPFRKPVEPGNAEVEMNPRARSARLRAAVRLGGAG